MTLIDSSYFVGDINVTNKSTTAVLERLQWFIDKYEPEFLKELMGYELYKVFEAETADFDGDASNGSIPQKWLDLIEGAEYTKSSKIRKFNGLLYSRGGTDLSPIADYVWYYWTEDQHTQTVGLGEAKAKAENADNVDPAEKLIKIWNQIGDWINEFYWFMQEHKDTYPEWVNFSWKERSLYRNFGKNNIFGF